MKKKPTHIGGAASGFSAAMKPWQIGGLFAAIALFFLAQCLSQVSTVKIVTMTCILLIPVTAFLFFTTLRDRIKLPLVVLALVVLMDGISTLYAISGKFALYEFAKVVTAFCLSIFLLALAQGDGVWAGRWIASVLEGCAALAGLVSIDLISTRLISTPVLAFLRWFTPDYMELAGVEVGIRMTSIFTNPNVFAGCVGIGVLLSLGLAVSAHGRRERMVHQTCLFINALAFVLAFSMGASAMIALAFLVYLALERKERRATLFILMAETLVLTVVMAGLISQTAFGAWKGIEPIPLLCMVGGGAALCVLDWKIGHRLAQRFEGHGKALLGSILGILVVIVAFSFLAYNLTGGVTLQAGEVLRRAIYPQPGEYMIVAQADGPVWVTVESQNQRETMMHTSTVLYEGELSGATFTVPEDSLVVYFNFSAQQEIALETARYDGLEGSGSIPLGYKLLPGFIANRLQGLFANQNAIQRLVFFSDGMKLFQRSPLFGLGVGAFENGIKSVQSFYYETKYAHNHYIQALVETGVVGLALFLTLLGVSGASVLLTGRKEDAHPLVPALGALLVFMAGHAATEVVFSSHAYLPLAFGVFALVNLCCGDTIPLPWSGKKVRTGILLGISALLAAFGVLLGGNLAARTLVTQKPTFERLVRAVDMDRFEWADYALSYVNGVLQGEVDEETWHQADVYAERLAQVNSNTIPIYLAQYYLSTGRTQRGLEMVEQYVNYVSSDQMGWQQAFDLLEGYEQDDEAYRAGVRKIAQMLEEWNRENLGIIRLDEETVAFLERMGFEGGAFEIDENLLE